jgi:hypothetical protein
VKGLRAMTEAERSEKVFDDDEEDEDFIEF